MVSRANLSIFHLFFFLSFADINEPPYFCLCSDSLKFLLALCICLFCLICGGLLIHIPSHVYDFVSSLSNQIPDDYVKKRK